MLIGDGDAADDGTHDTHKSLVGAADEDILQMRLTI